MDELIRRWRSILVDLKKSWVLFENGTCVVILSPEADLAVQATEILKRFGPVYIATPNADFNVLVKENGWVVTCHHPAILTYVSPEEVSETPSIVKIGLTGRSKRDRDAKAPNVIHVEK